jgi:ATP-grasp domain, R2K clade family 3
MAVNRSSRGTKSCVFLQNNLVTKLTVPVANWANARGIPIVDVSSNTALDVDRCGTDWSEYEQVLPYGSTQFIEKVSASAIFECLGYTAHAFEATRWNEYLWSRMLNGEGVVKTAQECGEFLEDGPRHIRPLTDGKRFNGGIYSKESWEEIFKEKALRDSMKCYISKPKEIEREWRVWFVDEVAIEASQYRDNGVMSVCKNEGCEEAMREAQSMANEWLPTKDVVMDVALTKDGFRIVELNPIHSSGWYAAHPDKILDNLWESKMKLKDHKFGGLVKQSTTMSVKK